LFAGCDVLIAFFSGPITAYLDCKGIPVIYLSDAAFNGMVDYYPAFCNLLNVNIRQAIKNEIKSFEACSAIVLSADWSKNFALQIAPQCEGKVHVIELGANIKDTDIHPRQYKYDGHLHLLFLGVDWNRKGGDLAVEATRWLNNHGVKTTLHIIGIRQLPSSLENDPAIDYIGFLNKNIESDYKRLVNEIYRCHALLLPTKAECSGIAFAEASAFGLPIFTHDTGGIPNYVYDGRNGYKLPLGSSGADFAQRIYTCIENGELEKMAIDAPNVYSEKLNWNTWTQRMGAIIQRLLG
jgi:glycosyltransferase involved in cell wall biosynthesis